MAADRPGVTVGHNQVAEELRRLHVLLDGLAGDLVATGDDEAAAEVRKAMEAKTADDKLRLAAQALPKHIVPGGANPLSVMYGDFSEGIHGKTDEECLEIAAELRKAFEFTFVVLRPHMEKLQEFQQDVQKRAGSRGGTKA